MSNLLMYVHRENIKEIIPAARTYQKAKVARMNATERETKAKVALLSLVKAAKLKPLDDGTIRFRCDGLLISITPRDELIKGKEEEE